jgi:hypothetical protein
VSKSIAKSRKKWNQDEYDDFDRVFVNKNKKNESVEVKRTKNRTFTKMKHMSNDELMDIFAREEELY